MVLQTTPASEPPSEEVEKKKSPGRALLEKILEKVEFTYVFISLFFFTDAVTMVLLSGGASEGDGFSYDSINYIPVHLFYVIHNCLTLFFVACRYKRTLYILLSNPVLIAASTVVGLSFFWSFAPDDSLSAGIFATCNMLFAVYLAGRYTLKQQITILSYVLLSISILNFVFVYALPQYGIMGPPVHPGAWRGVFTHKNGAGKMMVLACGVMYTMFNEVKDKRLKWLYIIGLFLSLQMINKTGSGGALLNSVFILTIVTVLQVFKTETRKLLLSLIFLISGAIFVSVAYVPLMTFALGLIGKDATLTGRTDIWEYIYTMIGHRPALGYGVGGFWHGTAGPSLYIWQRAGWRVPDAHQGFLDMTLQIGIIGTTLVSLVLWQTLLRGLARTRLFKTWVSSWPAAYTLYIVLINLAESSLLAPNSIFWILICSMSFTTSFEAKYLNDFDRFSLGNNNNIMGDKIMDKIKPSKNVQTTQTNI
ncbi:lipid A core-O-antigen ligase-like enyme [Leptolyngbya sp. PCC 7375]|nr:lipid A core-O-antigen ligase-like enyme [Leptolyngbya sp. PCC 7375]